MRLRLKFLLIFVLSTFIPVILFSFLMYTFFANHAEKRSVLESKMFLNQVNKNLTAHLNEIQRVSLIPNYDFNIQEGLNNPKIIITENTKATENLYSTLNVVMQFRMLPFCSGATIFHKDGTLLLSQYYSSKNSHLKRPLNQEQWFQEFMDDDAKTYMYLTDYSQWAELHENPESYFANWSFSYMQKLYSYPGHVLNGVLILDFKKELFEEILYQSENHGSYPHFFVYDTQNQQFLYQSTPQFMTEEMVNTIKPGAVVPVTVNTKVNGEEFLLTYFSQQESPWVLISVIPKIEMLRDAQVVYKAIAAVLIFCILFSSVLSFLFSKRLTSPIVELQELMKRVESGDLQVRYRHQRNDEIGYLGKSFNHMLDELDKTLYRSYTLEILRSQIHPHFLYNTLGAIAALAKIHNVSEIYTLSLALSKLFRYSINKNNDKWVTFEEELEHLRYYVEAQKIRFGEKVNVEWEIEPEIYSYKTIKLILQPILENAFMHGIEPKGEGTVRIRGKRLTDGIRMEISDNGIGMSHEKLQRVQHLLKMPRLQPQKREIEGIGILNVHQRIALTFGQPYGLEVQSQPHQGTTVQLLLPLVKEGE